MKYLIVNIAALVFLLAGNDLLAEDTIDRVRADRYGKTGFYHIGGGIGIYGVDNADLEAFLSAGFGSSRNLLNADIGIGYDFSTAVVPTSSPRIFGHRLPLSVSASINLIKGEKNCLYLGAGYAYTFALGASYTDASENLPDKQLIVNYSSATAKIGYRWNILDLSLRCRYALSPKYDQKYIYETEAYDFSSTQTQIFNRLQFGIVLTYYFRLGL